MIAALRARFGWCLDGLHARCRRTVGRLTCDCPCHAREAP